MITKYMYFNSMRNAIADNTDRQRYVGNVSQSPIFDQEIGDLSQSPIINQEVGNVSQSPIFQSNCPPEAPAVCISPPTENCPCHCQSGQQVLLSKFTQHFNWYNDRTKRRFECKPNNIGRKILVPKNGLCGCMPQCQSQVQAACLPSPVYQCSPNASICQGSPNAGISQGSPKASVYQGSPIDGISQGSPKASVYQGSPIDGISISSPKDGISQGSPKASFSNGSPNSTCKFQASPKVILPSPKPLASQPNRMTTDIDKASPKCTQTSPIQSSIQAPQREMVVVLVPVSEAISKNTSFQLYPKSITISQSTPKSITISEGTASDISACQVSPQKCKASPKNVSTVQASPNLMLYSKDTKAYSIQTDITSPNGSPKRKASPKVISNFRTSPKVVPNFQSPPKEIPNLQPSPKVIPKSNSQPSPKEIPNFQASPKEIPNFQASPKEIPNFQASPKEIPNFQASPKVITNLQASPKRFSSPKNTTDSVHTELSPKVNFQSCPKVNTTLSVYPESKPTVSPWPRFTPYEMTQAPFPIETAHAKTQGDNFSNRAYRSAISAYVQMPNSNAPVRIYPIQESIAERKRQGYRPSRYYWF